LSARYHFGPRGSAVSGRVNIVNGELEIRSAIGIGTEIELRVLASIAYGASTQSAWRSRLRR